ncbi:restriction endonuclease [Streptomyces californicus]|uniref:restriction endonuclease n=1 Tax=Streptomyces californicus TaxID=67351 RepID=UPI00364E5226
MTGTDTFEAVFDPDGRITGDLPPDRETHEQLVRAVLAWSDAAVLDADGFEQVGLLLSGAGHVVADDVRRYASRLGEDDGKRLFAEIVLGEAAGRLPRPSSTLRGVQNKARLLRSLYERLDRLIETAPEPSETPSA